MGYVVGYARGLADLEHGLAMLEICHDDDRRLIAGFVFVKNGVCDYRDVLGHPLAPGLWTSKTPERERRAGLIDGFGRAVANFLAA